MGLDFIRKAAKSFHKKLDQSRIDLGTPDLFTRPPDCAPRTYAMTIRADRNLRLGEDLSVCCREDRIVVQRGMDIVGVLNDPPTELREALQESHGEAYGKIEVIYEIADTAEITVC